MSYDNIKRRYLGSLIVTDRIINVVNEMVTLYKLNSDEMKDLLQVNFYQVFNSMDEIKSYLADTITNYKQGVNLFNEKKYSEAILCFKNIHQLPNAQKYIRRIQQMQELYTRIDKLDDVFSIIDFLEDIEKKRIRYLDELDIHVIKSELINRVYIGIGNLIDELEFLGSEKALLRMRTLYGRNENSNKLHDQLSNKRKEKVVSKRNVDEKGFYWIRPNETLTHNELIRFHKFYLAPYYRYNMTVPRSEERDYTVNVLKFKDGNIAAVNRYAERLNEIIPNDNVVLCFIPSSNSQKKYFQMKWENGEKVEDLDNPINPPLADLIYCLTNADLNQSYDRQLSKNYSKLGDTLKRIDGSKVLIRKKTVESAHNGGNRDINIHLESIGVTNNNIIKNKVVWLIDDVVTTGNSYEACSTLLRSNGAAKVYFIALGKTTSVRNQEDTCIDFIDNL